MCKQTSKYRKASPIVDNCFAWGYWELRLGFCHLSFIHCFLKNILVDNTMLFTGEIKRICETNLGIVSQCCQPQHVNRCNKQYLENLSLKINVKVCLISGSKSLLIYEIFLNTLMNKFFWCEWTYFIGWRQE